MNQHAKCQEGLLGANQIFEIAIHHRVTTSHNKAKVFQG